MLLKYQIHTRKISKWNKTGENKDIRQEIGGTDRVARMVSISK